jgi:hypothetical protein
MKANRILIDEDLLNSLVGTLEQIVLLSLTNRNLLRDDRPDQARIDSVIHQLGAGALELLEQRAEPLKAPKCSKIAKASKKCPYVQKNAA